MAVWAGGQLQGAPVLQGSARKVWRPVRPPGRDLTRGTGTTSPPTPFGQLWPRAGS